MLTLPVKDGHMVVAVLYGYSGASAEDAVYQQNEQLLAHAYLRMRQLNSVQYFLCTDLNVNPSKSKVVSRAITDHHVYDIVDQAYAGAPPNTYKKGSISEGMEGTGSTRIDTVLTNAAAANACDLVTCLFKDFTVFDHCPNRGAPLYREVPGRCVCRR